MRVVSPLSMENHFHLLFDANSEENVCRFLPSFFKLVIHYVLIRAVPTPLFRFRVVIQGIGKEIGHFKMAVLHNMGPTIPRGMIGLVHKAKAIKAKSIIKTV